MDQITEIRIEEVFDEENASKLWKIIQEEII